MTNKNQMFRIKNNIIDKYLDEVNNNNENNQSFRYYEYFIIFCYYLNLIKLIYCLNKSNEIRLLLFDISIFTGGLQQYSSITFIIGCNFAALLFRILHMNKNKNLFKWIQLFEALSGRISPQSIDIYSELYDEKETQQLFSFAKIIYKLSNIIYKIIGKTIIILTVF